jgi:hypothetical protein
MKSTSLFDTFNSDINKNAKWQHTVRTWRYLYGILWGEGQEAGSE